MGDKLLLNGVISNLRACLLSAKGGVSFFDLNNDYSKIVGGNIPFAKLGYPSLNELLNDIPGLVITRRGNDWNVAARPTEDTVHLTNMIARQKSAPKKRSRGLTARHRRPTSSQWGPPLTFRNKPQVRRDQSSNHYAHQSFPSSNISPLMSLTPKKVIPSLFDQPPRYMLPNPGSPQTSPSKRLSDRKSNSSPQSAQQNSGNYQTTPIVPYKNKAAAQAAMNATILHTSTSFASSVTPPSAPGLASARNPEPITAHQPPKPLKTMNARLLINSQPTPQPTVTRNSPNHIIHRAPSNPVAVTPPPTPTLATQSNWPNNPQHQDPCRQLEALAESMNLNAPVYKSSTWNVKRQTFWGCQVTVGIDRFTSYPEEIPTAEAAMKVVATKAVKELCLKAGSLSTLSETTNKDLVKQRLMQIVAEHQNGVFESQIPTYYKEQYKENLPEEWGNLIEECATIFKEKGANDSTILCPYVPRSDNIESDKTAELLSPRLEKVELSPIGPPVPVALQLPTEQYWDVCITTVLSTVDIWARLIGEEYSEKFDSMMNSLETHYKKLTTTGVTAIEVGNFYAVQEEDTWHRVECTDFNARTGIATVYFIDHGDEDTFPHHKLWPLEKRFCRVPAQAVNLCLADLEEFSSCEQVIDYLEELLLEQTLIAQVVSREVDDGTVIPSVVLYDTRDLNDVNLNEVLLQKISQNILTPKLKQDQQVSQVFLSHVTKRGDIYLHVKSDSMKHLVNLINALIQTGLTNEDVQRSEVKTISSSHMYFARCFEDGNWYRGVVTKVGANNTVEVLLVDIGKTIIVEEKRHLLLLSELSTVLAKYPHQALKVQLHEIPESMFNSSMAEKLVALAPPNEQLLAKVVKPASGSIPAVVELFKRLEPNNLLVSLNHSLVIDSEKIGANGDGNNNTRPRKRLERTISRHRSSGDGDIATKNLKPPTIPDFGQYFDVHITMAANPGNFTVQPYSDRVQLEAMMVELQGVCVNYSGPSPSSESVKEGSLYAAKHFDGHFYRVCISNIINEQMVTVYFCDFGDVTVLTLDMLQPLGRQFRNLPYQAIRARLVGVQPVNIDWSVDDCLRFQELVVQKDFVSEVVESGPDRLSPGDTVLGLKLIDVSKEIDIYLDKLLIEEGRAEAVE